MIPLHPTNRFQKLIRYLRQRQQRNIQLRPLDQVQQQIKRALINVRLNPVFVRSESGKSRFHALNFSIGTKRDRPDRARRISRVDPLQLMNRPVAVNQVVPDAETDFFPEGVPALVPRENDERGFLDSFPFERAQR